MCSPTSRRPLGPDGLTTLTCIMAEGAYSDSQPLNAVCRSTERVIASVKLGIIESSFKQIAGIPVLVIAANVLRCLLQLIRSKSLWRHPIRSPGVRGKDMAASRVELTSCATFTLSACAISFSALSRTSGRKLRSLRSCRDSFE